MLLKFYVDSEGAVAPQPIGLPRHKAVTLAAPVWVWKRRPTARRLWMAAASVVVLTALLLAHPFTQRLF